MDEMCKISFRLENKKRVLDLGTKVKKKKGKENKEGSKK